MYKAVKKTKVARRYMEVLALHTDAQTVHWKDNTSCIYVVEAKIVTPIVKHIAITLCFLLEQFHKIAFWFPNMKILVSRWNLCASNHIAL